MELRFAGVITYIAVNKIGIKSEGLSYNEAAWNMCAAGMQANAGWRGARPGERNPLAPHFSDD